MAYLPPGSPWFDATPARGSLSPPPWRPPRSSPPPPPWRPPRSPPSNGKPTSPGGMVTGVVIAAVASLLVFTIVCSLCKGYRNSHAAAAAAAAARPRSPPRPRDHGELHRRRDCDARPQRASPTAGLLAFTYSRSVKHNVTGVDEESTCSVCLGAFQLGETVRLLPVCLHLYHVECIDPWLDAHSTCPLCRSDTDPTTDVGQVPPV